MGKRSISMAASSESSWRRPALKSTLSQKRLAGRLSANAAFYPSQSSSGQIGTQKTCASRFYGISFANLGRNFATFTSCVNQPTSDPACPLLSLLILKTFGAPELFLSQAFATSINARSGENKQL